ncbi:M15 family metallopeptidase [Methyloligella halotolerans]|nr:M15 family metallopeptidase [Methyloligella halotolerans]
MNRTGTIGVISALWAILFTLPAIAADGAMPDGFVYLRDVAPSIRQEMRYAGSKNFTGEPVPGYEAAECILARPAAEALKAVQAEIQSDGLSLKVYDCYRPKRAVAAFVEWAKAPDDPQAKREYYPSLSKDALFPAYIATRSGHSRGATVDLTLVPGDAPAEAMVTQQRVACTQADPSDDSLDMGTSFDCFDTKANTAAPGLTAEERQNRQRLVEVMAAHGFRNYPKEFWHYTFRPEPYPSTYFDFPILPRPTSGGAK